MAGYKAVSAVASELDTILRAAGGAATKLAAGAAISSVPVLPFIAADAIADAMSDDEDLERYHEELDAAREENE